MFFTPLTLKRLCLSNTVWYAFLMFTALYAFKTLGRNHDHNRAHRDGMRRPRPGPADRLTATDTAGCAVNALAVERRSVEGSPVSNALESRRRRSRLCPTPAQAGPGPFVRAALLRETVARRSTGGRFAAALWAAMGKRPEPLVAVAWIIDGHVSEKAPG